MLSEFDRAVADRRKALVEEFVEDGNLPRDFEAPEPPPRKPVPEKPDGGRAQEDVG